MDWLISIRSFEYVAVGFGCIFFRVKVKDGIKSFVTIKVIMTRPPDEKFVTAGSN